MTRRLEQVVVFAGGTGSQGLVRHLVFEAGAKVTLLVNAYDDGKSTGILRGLIPGFLGPSDFRKNIVNLIPEDYAEGSAARHLLEYRFPADCEDGRILSALKATIADPFSENYYGLHRLLSHLSPRALEGIQGSLASFVSYFESLDRQSAHLLRDMAFGNLILAGLFLKKNRSFNDAIAEMHLLFPVCGRVLNVTGGENRVLVGLRQDGFIAGRESEIVQDHSDFAYDRIFLLKNYPAPEELKNLREKKKEEALSWLEERNDPPPVNPAAEEALASADLVIAAPGTQFSSLFPTYVTRGLGALLQKTEAPKAALMNIGEDFDTSKVTARFLFDKATEHFGLQQSPFTHCLVNDPEAKGGVKKKGSLILMKPGNFSEGALGTSVLSGDWEDEENQGKHHSLRVTSALAKILWEKKAFPNPFGFKSLSIVIPAYNEEKCVAPLLKKILSVDFSPYKTFAEILFVDDGSKDKTAAEAKKFENVKVFAKEANGGKGSAVKEGIKASRGDIVVIQDADLEYEPEELLHLLRPMIEEEFKAVYGSRSLRSAAPKRHLKFIYRKKPEQYWMAYVGGHILSLWTFLWYGRYLTDTLTAYKMYDGELLRSLVLTCNGFELDHEITAKILKQGIDILEVPVSYKPRTHEEGKKIKMSDGLTALWTIFKFRFARRNFSRIFLPHEEKSNS